MAPLEPWEKVLIDSETFPDTVHGIISCTDCHAGRDTGEKEVAHEGLIHDPSANPDHVCGICHEELAAMSEQNLHANLQGYWTVLDERRDLESESDHVQLQEMFGNHCGSCHATCGQCHISQPELVGGGLIDGHLFKETPSMTRNCAACHGSRVGNEYLGRHEGLAADVHFRQGRMNCVDCHPGADMHGEVAETSDEAASAGTPPNHRYDGSQAPQCETCHALEDIILATNPMHMVHGDNMQCQICHSISYTSCDGCHVAISETSGNPFFATDASYLSLLIGRNPRMSEERPYGYVLVRHIPVAQDSFSYYGDNLLPFFDSLPTWKYTTPHNIQRDTPQTETCNACHGNPELFLTIDKIQEDEIEANRNVLVETIPPAIPEDELP